MDKTKIKTYDFIIAGAGCAGLSLLYRILKEPSLNQKKILVLDKDPKTQNDKTWCFWEKKEGMFNAIIHHSWEYLKYYSPTVNKTLELDDYVYKMIRGIDFYKYVLDFSKQFNNVTFELDEIISITSKNQVAKVTTTTSGYSSKFVFNSTGLFHPEMDTSNSLLQHFEGWVIKTKDSHFDSNTGTLMDFRLPQTNGATFMYVLPTKDNEALVEYTLFSPSLLNKTDYKVALKNYIKNVLKIDAYEILHTEFGVIPMSLSRFSTYPISEKNVINIGTAGGWTKASSGYTFQFIQKNTATIVENLIKGNNPVSSLTFQEKIFKWYDRTLLDVLINKKMTGEAVFSKMFKAVPAATILKFLDNESSLKDDLHIMSRFPFIKFLTSGLKQLK